MRYRTRSRSSNGSMWMSEASAAIAPSISRLTSRTTGASKARSRRCSTSSSGPPPSAPSPMPSTIFCSAVPAPWARSSASRIAGAGATQTRTSSGTVCRSSSCNRGSVGSAIAMVTAPSSTAMGQAIA